MLRRIYRISVFLKKLKIVRDIRGLSKLKNNNRNLCNLIARCVATDLLKWTIGTVLSQINNCALKILVIRR